MSQDRELRLVNDSDEGALTPIHTPIHSVATNDATDVEGMSEMDRLDVDAFIETLSSVALAIAQRRTNETNEGAGS